LFTRPHHKQASQGEVGYKKISVEKAYWLERPISMEEIKESVWDCDGSRSPRPDDFNFKFYRKVWNLICYDLYDMMNEFFQLGKLSKRATMHMLL
jgi:hypothetical protein